MQGISSIIIQLSNVKMGRNISCPKEIHINVRKKLTFSCVKGHMNHAYLTKHLLECQKHFDIK